MAETQEEPREELKKDEREQPGQPQSGGRLEGLARLGGGAVMVAAGVFLRFNPEMHGMLVMSQRPAGVEVPFFSAFGTLLWLLAPYGLMVGGVVVAGRGAWMAITGR